MARTGPLPRKIDGLHAQELDGEFVVVDDNTQQAHALSGTAADLWRGIDAGIWPDATDADLDLAVADLQTLGLVASPGLSRRTLMRGGSIAVAGAVITIGLPSIAAASSHGPGTTPSATTMASNPASPPAGSTFQINVTVAPAPTGGTVTLVNTSTGTTYPVQPASGAVAFSVVAGAQGVTHTFTATFSGDTTHAGSSGNLLVTYAPVSQQATVTTADNLESGAGATYFVDVAVKAGGTQINGGTVTASATGCTVFPASMTIPASGTSPVTFTVTNPVVGTPCQVTFVHTADANYASSRWTSVVYAASAVGAPVTGVSTAP